ncbi:MAG: Gfo/Idh/MocA family oxidoreductase [Verrucomicrobia bacterium]|nr:Gfo/Idh/MocA family oxidoreductase [Verrucomicrobiota bacterium]
MKAFQNQRISRRRFLGRTAAAAGALAAPCFIPATALGAEGRAAPSERIVMGAIGLGGRGRYDLGAFMNNPDVQVRAVCDVNRKRREQGKAQVDKKYGNADCAAYRDFLELLARKDIDAVLIATGDNWHSLASVTAARAGKDIYCEKPLSVAIAESRAVVEAVASCGRVFQCGTQRRSIARFRFAVDLARSGALGRVHTLYAEKAPMNPEYFRKTLPPEPQPPIEEFDWDRWLGPAAWRPYNHLYPTRGFWSKHLDFSGGAINEWGSHTVDLCQWANNADRTGPVEFEPWQGTVVAHYANGVKLVFKNGKWPLDVQFVGTEGVGLRGRRRQSGDRSAFAQSRPAVRQGLSGRKPHPQLPGLRQIAPDAHFAAGDGASVDFRLSLREHLQAVGAALAVGSDAGGVRRGRGGQPDALPGHPRAVANLNANRRSWR